MVNKEIKEFASEFSDFEGFKEYLESCLKSKSTDFLSVKKDNKFYVFMSKNIFNEKYFNRFLSLYNEYKNSEILIKHLFKNHESFQEYLVENDKFEELIKLRENFKSNSL